LRCIATRLAPSWSARNTAFIAAYVQRSSGPPSRITRASAGEETLHAVELLEHGRLDQRVYRPHRAGTQVLARRPRGGHDPVGRDGDAHLLEPPGDGGAGVAGGVREHREPDPGGGQAADGVGRSRKRRPVDVQHALHVEHEGARRTGHRWAVKGSNLRPWD
jgi:hypothetical protein